MHLFPEIHFRRLMQQAADQQGSDDDAHVVRRLLLHPRAFRAAHQLIEQRFEDATPDDQVQAIVTAANFGDFAGIFQWIVANWSTILADIVATLKLFGLLK